jgi:hypothetical protein
MLPHRTRAIVPRLVQAVKFATFQVERTIAKVRAYLQHALDVTHGCVVEMILKDTHTCQNHPERFTAWTDIARELVEG